MSTKHIYNNKLTKYLAGEPTQGEYQYNKLTLSPKTIDVELV